MMQRMAVPVAQVYKRELRPEWEGVISGAASADRVERIRKCGSSYWVWKCRRDGTEVHVRKGCKDPLCYHCSRGYSKGLTDDMMGVLDVIYQTLHDKVSYSGFEFTIPHDLWDKIGEADLKTLRDWAIDILKEYYGAEFVESGDKAKDRHRSRKRRYVIGGIVAAQFWHSFTVKRKGNVWRGWYPHVHATVWDRMWDNRASQYDVDGFAKGGGAFVKRRVSLSGHEVKALRDKIENAWRSRVEGKFGKSNAPVWNMHYSYGDTRADAERRAAYMIRGVVQDSYREAVHNGYQPSETQKAWVSKMLTPQRHKKRYVAFGWFADCVVNRYVAKAMIGGLRSCPQDRCGHAPHLGRCAVKVGYTEWPDSPKERYVERACLCEGLRPIAKKKERDRERRKVYCPNCGGEMERQDCVRSHQEVLDINGVVMGYGYAGGWRDFRGV